MRPDILNPLFANAAKLPGIGPKLEKALGKLFGRGDELNPEPAKIIDLLFHVPSGMIDRRNRPTIDHLPETGIVTVEIEVGRHRAPPAHNKRIPYRVDCFDDTGSLSLVFFHAYGDYLQKALPTGETRFVSGRIEWFNGAPQIVHPDHILNEADFARMPPIEPVYPMTAGISPKTLGKGIRSALEHLPALSEWDEPNWLERHAWPAFSDALTRLHLPTSVSDLAADSPARKRLAYDELLANQLALALVRRQMRRASGRVLSGDGLLMEKIETDLPFSLTASQRVAVGEIVADMALPERMLRLLQGDVGSGKTAVAVLALARAVEAGAQGALMVPTDILARQHGETVAQFAKAAGITVDVLTGRDKGKTRQDVLDRLRTGQTGILIGTHALFQHGVEFNNLGLVIIDEQHRFGVHQRLALQAKAGGATDLLVMTATPIPRTLSLTLYGDMEVSRLTEKPAGRQAIDTRVLPIARLAQVVDGLARAMQGGARIYWVCPLVEDSDLIDLTSAEDRFAGLNTRYRGQVGLIHGRMKGPAKDAVMQQFKDGEISILVSTTVIEVGVDVPEASIIVIEHAERFGLAQLHQLRGRVGRGAAKSSCLLLYQEPLGETAKARLSTMRETEDGFVIAEEDLRLRGSGELLGTRQSGVPAFKLADLAEDGELLAAARDDVELVLRSDPQLQNTRGDSLKLLLYLFERDEAVRLLSAG
ncbi:MAG: ATP-dependent DNA helicase RecG [Rhizobiales bacterium]|nr:ATP-dependent DNA helicase RecG [Hyphomicrobiales bacterium]